MAPLSKAALRASMTARLAAIDPESLRRQSESLCRELLHHPAIAGVRTLMAYAPMPGEADVKPLAAAWALLASSRPERRLCIPRVDWAAKRMEPVEIRDWQSELDDGPRPGLLNPSPGLPAVDPIEVDAVLVPGLAFDQQGGRLGRGAGFYDRFLAGLGPRPGRMIIGIALSEQLIPQVPVEPHDVKMGWIATPEGLQRIGP